MARILYWGSGSAWCWRIQIALEEKGLDYESRLISFSKKEHKGPDILKYNPRGQVPTFIDGDVVVNESTAACEYLEAAYATRGVKLMPEDIKLKALVLQRMHESSNLYTPVVEAFRFKSYGTQEGTPDATQWEEKKAAIRKELAIWEGYLQGKSFLVGDSITMADVFFIPFLASGARYGIDYKKAGFPALAAYNAQMTERKSVQNTWPPHWKEGPGNGALAEI